MENTDYRSQYYMGLGSDADDWIEYLASKETTNPEQQRRFTGKDGVATYRDALQVIDRFLFHAEKLGVCITPESRLLDFGCGWGRITKTATRYFEPKHITSVDVFEGALDLFRASKFSVTIVKSEPNPPLALEGGHYDFIFAYSVFSHLNEEKAKAWMQEFKRLLKPGGIAALTTYPRGFISYVSRLREDPQSARAYVASAFLDTTKSLQRYDDGEFVFDQEKTDGPLKGVGYGEACIPGGYVKRVWGPDFRKVLFIPAHEAKTPHSLIFCLK